MESAEWSWCVQHKHVEFKVLIVVQLTCHNLFTATSLNKGGVKTVL